MEWRPLREVLTLHEQAEVYYQCLVGEIMLDLDVNRRAL